MEAGPVQVVRYNSYESIRIGGNAAPGYTTGDAMAEMERLVAQLPPGYGFEWNGLSYQERQAGNQAPILMGLSLLVVFLVLAALYESWAIRCRSCWWCRWACWARWRWSARWACPTTCTSRWAW